MTITDYQNFDVLITQSGEQYRAFLVHAPAGDDDNWYELPFTPAEVKRLGGLGLGASRSVGAAGRADPATDLATWGGQLFEALFGNVLRARLTASLASTAEEGTGLRLRLRFAENAADLALLPWEILYDQGQQQFVGLAEASPILRYLSLPRSRSALLVEPPLRVLAVPSSPTDLSSLDIDREWQAVQTALAPLTADGKVVLERLARPTLAALQERLLGGPVHILHLVGHGVFDETAQAGSLALEDERGRAHFVRGDDLAKLLRNHPDVRLIYLSACEGALGSGQSAFAGVAQSLVRGGAPAAVAMQAEISDAGAIELARAFYTALAAGRPVDAALTQARVALSAAGSLEWAIPVLFSRSPDNRLFDLRQVLPTPDCPYPGMVPFGEDQQALFFGRDKEVEEAVERLRQHPFLAVVGPSGSGKSSLVYAGVIPALRKTRRFGPGEWALKTMRPGQQPLDALAALLGCAPDEAATHHFEQRTLLLVDQFEETFTLAGTDAAQCFLDALKALIGQPNLHILLTVRADFYSDLMACSLWPAIRANRLELTPLGDDELWAAIVEPAGRVGVTIDEALAVRLIADAAGERERGSLPLVQETLVLLWEKVKDRHLSLSAYRGMGEGGRSGLQVAIDRRASSVYDNLPEPAQPLARRTFLRLIQFGEGRADTRRQQRADELRASGDDAALFDATLARLVDSRLLTASGEMEGARRVDIAHEALITGWPRLQGWLEARQVAEQTRRRLEAKAAEWIAADKRGGLLDEYELQEAEHWLASEDAQELGYSQDLVELLRVSKAKLDEEKAETEAQRQRELQQQTALAHQAKRLRVLLVIVSVAFLFATIAGLRAQGLVTISQILLRVQTSFLANIEAYGLNREVLAQQRERLQNSESVLKMLTPLKHRLPDLSALALADARTKLAELCSPGPCLDTRLRWVTSDDVARGLVVGSDPGPHTRVHWGTPVTLTISLGSLQPISDLINIDLVTVPEGDFLMGSDLSSLASKDDEWPAHKIYLPDYLIGKTEITNAQYAVFVQAPGNSVQSPWPNATVPDGQENHPVVSVSWYDAVRYTRWLSDVTDQPYRLCTEAEWEKACRGSTGQIYPWGNVFDSDRLSLFGRNPELMPVGAYSPHGDSVYGVTDMAGNAFEWTSSFIWPYPYEMDDGREHMYGPGERAQRGGIYFTQEENSARCAARFDNFPDSRFNNLGFRVCMSAID